MNSIKVLDVTLRDGGCVNNFNFGQDYMQKILSAQELSGVDIIELGYIDEKNGTTQGRSQWADVPSISNSLLKHKKSGVTYVAMMDYGKYNVDNIPPRLDSYIDGIRVAFHKKDRTKIVEIGEKIKDKGYELFIQPMITLRYTDVELLELIDLINTKLSFAKGFYIVDSFGEMRPNDMSRVLNIVDHNLNPNILLGYHSHNNLQMSYSNACSMLQFPTNRDIIIDCSIMGMGKGAGNLNTELLMEHLNLYYGKKYKISPLLEVIDKVINQIHSENYWGYSPEFYLSSANHCTPSYAAHFYNKHMLPIDQVSELLSLIDEDKKISFDKNYAEDLYRSYNENKSVDDKEVVEELKGIIHGNQAIIVAPGKSINENRDKINSFLKRKDIISFGLNVSESWDTDFIVATRQDSFEDVLLSGRNIITTSNISKGTRGNIKILDYKKWIEVRGDKTFDSSAVIVLNLLKYCEVTHIYIAGMDGFSTNINENYADPSLRRPVTEEQAVLRNDFYKTFISDMIQNGVVVEFITPSKYQ